MNTLPDEVRVRNLIKTVFIEAQKGGGYTNETEEHFLNAWQRSSASPSTASNEDEGDNEFLTTQFPGKQKLKNTDEEDLKHFLKVEDKSLQQAAKEWKQKFQEWYLNPEQSWQKDGMNPKYIPYMIIEEWIEKNIAGASFNSNKNSIQQAHDKAQYE